MLESLIILEDILCAAVLIYHYFLHWMLQTTIPSKYIGWSKNYKILTTPHLSSLEKYYLFSYVLQENKVRQTYDYRPSAIFHAYTYHFTSVSS